VVSFGDGTEQAVSCVDCDIDGDGVVRCARAGWVVRRPPGAPVARRGRRVAGATHHRPHTLGVSRSRSSYSGVCFSTYERM
jgi:hypothetical protein